MGSWQWKGRAGEGGPAHLSPWGSPKGLWGAGEGKGVLGRGKGVLSTHHGAGSPHQQGHGVLVLLQQGDGGVSDLPVLALEDDEDGFPGKLQQPPEPFPARQVRDRGVRDPPAPLPLPWELLCSHLKLLLHQSCSRYATESTTMRRRQRLTFMMRSADGSVGKKGLKPPGPCVTALPSPAWCPPELGRMFCSSRKSL